MRTYGEPYPQRGGHPTAPPADYPRHDFPTSQAIIHADQIREGDWIHYFGRWVPVEHVTTDGDITTVTLQPVVYSTRDDVQVCAPLVDRTLRSNGGSP